MVDLQQPCDGWLLRPTVCQWCWHMAQRSAASLQSSLHGAGATFHHASTTSLLLPHPHYPATATTTCSPELRGLPGVWAAVKYVCHMPEEQRDLALISTHAK